MANGKKVVFICPFNFETEITSYLAKELKWHGEVVLPLPNQVRNLRFEITIKDDKLNFDYKLSEGVCSTMNASFLMKKMGIVD